MGRQPEITPEIHKQIVMLVRKHLVINQSAESIGIAKSTAKHWIYMGDADRKNGINDSVYARFSADIRAAQAAKVLELMSNIEVREERWQANAWLLERCVREDFGADAAILMDIVEKFNEMQKNFNKSQGAK